MSKLKQSRLKKRERKNISIGVAHILSTFNNINVTFTNNDGATISWSTAGKNGFKGAKKSTPFAAQVTAEDAAKAAKEHGLKTIKVKTRGLGPGREAALRALMAAGFIITSIRDETPVPFNGCRPRKRRRV